MARDTGTYSPWITLLAIVTIIGAINWGLVGVFNWNLVDAIFGGGAREVTSAASRVVYTVVGLAGIALVPFLFLMPNRRPPATPV